MGGFFKVDRVIFDHEIWGDVVGFRLFFLILGQAVFHEDGIEQAGIHIKRGQWLRSYRNLRKDLEYREGRGYKQYGLATIKRSIQRLIEKGMITVSETEHGTLFTVVNYEKYQGFRGRKESKEEHLTERQRNDSGTTAERQRNNNNNDNKDKNDKEKDSWLDGSDPSPGNEALKKIENHFIQRRGIGILPSASDLESMQSLLDDNIPLSEIIAGIDQAFDRYKPKHRRDGIKRFAYCETVIRSMYQKKKEREQIQQQGGYNHAINGERGTQDTKDTGGKESNFITSSYYDQFEGLFGEGG